jgi:2-methylisocitrate lyase-like PEP mutase family enzyme
MTQNEKALRFRALHERAGAFLIPNPWDAGSARILAALGFEAFATSSGAAAATFGRRVAAHAGGGDCQRASYRGRDGCSGLWRS